MVLCLMTLTDLQTRRAGLSASAELLVEAILVTIYDCIVVVKSVITTPKRTLLGRKHIVRAINHENLSMDSTWIRARE